MEKLKNKTLAECSQELSKACRKLFLIVAYELKIDKLCQWLTKLLNCLKRGKNGR